MIPFAVWHEGLDEGTGRWVLAVDTKNVLVVNNEGHPYWRPLADCKVVRFATPDQPLLVLPVQAQQQPQIVLPQNGFLKGRN